MIPGNGLAARLRKLADELLREATTIDASEDSAPQGRAGCRAPSRSELEMMRPRFLQQAQRSYERRSLRPSYFDGLMLGEPAWDMLLDLYLQFGRGERISTNSVCIASRTAQTTALRYLDHLLDLGLIEKVRNEADRRVLLISLSEAGIDALDRYFWMSFAKLGEVRGHW